MNPFTFRRVFGSHLADSSPSSVVEAYAFFNGGSETILALAVNGDVLFLRPNDDDPVEGDFSVHKFRWEREGPKRIITCMAFSPCGRWLACMVANGSIEIVPVALALPDYGNKLSPHSLFDPHEPSTIDLRVRDDCLGLPTCAIWYETKQKRHMLIYSNKGGDIVFVDLVVRRLSASLQAPQSIHNLEIIEEAAHDDMYLLVSGFTGTQWLVPLEQQKMSLRETLARIIPSELKELNVSGSVMAVRSGGRNCIGVLYENTFKLFSTTNFGTPIMDIILPENTFAVRYTDAVTFTIHKQIFVSYSFNSCSISEYASETREQFTSMIGKLTDCRFLGFVPLPANIADGAFPSCLFITETAIYLAVSRWTTREFLASLLLTDKKLPIIELYGNAVGLNFPTSCFDAVPALLERKAIDRALQICNLSKAPLYDIAKQFVERGFASFILPHVDSWLLGSSNKVTSVTEESKRELSQLAFELHVEMWRNSEGIEKNKAEQNFKNFLLYNLWYDADYCMKTLLNLKMYDSALVVVKVHGLYEHLAKELITMECWDDNDDAFLSLASVHGLSSILLDPNSTYCHHYLARVQKVYSNLNWSQRVRFLAIFDPEQEEMRRLLDYSNSTRKNAGGLMHSTNSPKSPAKEALRFFISASVAFLYESLSSCTDQPTLEQSASSNTRQNSVEYIPVACGADHVAVAASDGRVYAFGRSRHGCLGDRVNASSPFSLPVPIQFPGSVKVQALQVACGSGHTLVLTKSGSIYSWGSNRFGQLGVGPKLPHSNRPVCLNDGRSETVNFIKVQTGQYHCFALDRNGKPWGWGWNVHRQVGAGNRADDLFRPVKLTIFDNTAVKSISCGYAHTLFLTDSGRLYGCGNNTYGQLAMDKEKKVARPRPLTIDGRKEGFDLIASGFFHNIALTKGGRLFTWGITPQALKFKALLQKRKHQQQAPSGNATTSTQNSAEPGLVDIGRLRPSQVDLTGVNCKNIVQLCCGFHHCLLRTDDGRIYTWGKGFEFQLGHGDKKERNSPSLVTSVAHSIAFASCGSDFTIVVDENRLLWGWGKNDNCQLGFESVASDEKNSMAGRVLTIQRPNKTGRTIQLPQDARSYVAKPMRIPALRSIWPMDSTNQMEEQLKKKYTQLYLMNVLKNQKGRYDLPDVLETCDRYGAKEMRAFVCLVHGNVEMSCGTLLDELMDKTTVDAALVFYTDLVEKCDLSISKLAEILRVIFDRSESLRSKGFDVNELMEKKLTFWAPAVVQLLTENPNSVPLNIGLKMECVRMVRRNPNGRVAGENGNYVVVDQETLNGAVSAGGRYLYRFTCGHVVEEQAVRTALGAMADNELIGQRSPRLAQLVQGYLENLEKLPADACPICMTHGIGHIFNIALVK